MAPCLPPSSERTKFVSLRDGFTQLQKSHQHLEREMGRRKEREKELLAFSEKLSSANAELLAERSNWETKVCVYACSLLLNCRTHGNHQLLVMVPCVILS